MGDEWSEWANYIIKSLDRIEKKQKEDTDSLYEKLNAVIVEIAIIKTKSVQSGAVMGAIFGIISAVIVALIIRGLTR